MIKILLGGSPCTFWSIAQKNNRETEAKGLGWELFKNYLIAKEKFKPDFFLYENNKSAAQAIKDQISRELDVDLMHINSALVSAQNRERFYAFNWEVEQLTDRGISLKDILTGEIADEFENVGECETLKRQIPKIVLKKGYLPEMFNAYNAQEIKEKSPTLSTGSMVTSSCATTILVPTTRKIYEVKNGKITYDGTQYPVKLPDGFYIIRKLTVGECMRLQTIPDWYEFPVSDSQAFRMIANGWTIEVIKHLLNHIPNIRDEEIEVLSMYDGMSCGQIALKELGCNVVRYYATEIDKYAIQTTLYNFPNTIQLGDAFQVREEGWHI